MKEIIIFGNDNAKGSILSRLKRSPKYRIKTTLNPEEAQEIIATLRPDFVLCTGKMRINSEGKYFLEIK